MARIKNTKETEDELIALIRNDDDSEDCADDISWLLNTVVKGRPALRGKTGYQVLDTLFAERGRKLKDVQAYILTSDGYKPIGDPQLSECEARKQVATLVTDKDAKIVYVDRMGKSTADAAPAA